MNQGRGAWPSACSSLRTVSRFMPSNPECPFKRLKRADKVLLLLHLSACWKRLHIPWGLCGAKERRYDSSVPLFVIILCSGGHLSPAISKKLSQLPVYLCRNREVLFASLYVM